MQRNFSRAKQHAPGGEGKVEKLLEVLVNLCRQMVDAKLAAMGMSVGFALGYLGWMASPSRSKFSSAKISWMPKLNLPIVNLWFLLIGFITGDDRKKDLAMRAFADEFTLTASQFTIMFCTPILILVLVHIWSQSVNGQIALGWSVLLFANGFVLGYMLPTTYAMLHFIMTSEGICFLGEEFRWEEIDTLEVDVRNCCLRIDVKRKARPLGFCSLSLKVSVPPSLLPSLQNWRSKLIGSAHILSDETKV